MLTKTFWYYYTWPGSPWLFIVGDAEAYAWAHILEVQ